MKISIYMTLIALINLFVSNLAIARDNTFYVGASYIDFESDIVDEKDNDTGWEGRLGYHLNKNVSFEVNYLDLGTLKVSPSADLGASIDRDAYSIAALGTYPVEGFDLIGKVGYLWWDADGEITTIAGPLSFSEDDSEFLVGVGIAYKFTQHFEIKIEYTKAESLDIGSLGVNFYF